VEYVHCSTSVLQELANRKCVPMEQSKESMERLNVMFVHLAILAKQVFKKNVQPTRFAHKLMLLYTLTLKHVLVDFI